MRRVSAARDGETCLRRERSVRGGLRVAARLIRPENGYVIWSDTYDRPWDDALVVQDDVAGKVTKALQASIAAKPDETPSHQ